MRPVSAAEVLWAKTGAPAVIAAITPSASAVRFNMEFYPFGWIAAVTARHGAACRWFSLAPGGAPRAQVARPGVRPECQWNGVWCPNGR
jgi:hypothetical protein